MEFTKHERQLLAQLLGREKDNLELTLRLMPDHDEVQLRTLERLEILSSVERKLA